MEHYRMDTNEGGKLKWKQVTKVVAISCGIGLVLFCAMLLIAEKRDAFQGLTIHEGAQQRNLDVAGNEPLPTITRQKRGAPTVLVIPKKKKSKKQKDLEDAMAIVYLKNKIKGVFKKLKNKKVKKVVHVYHPLPASSSSSSSHSSKLPSSSSSSGSNLSSSSSGSGKKIVLLKGKKGFKKLYKKKKYGKLMLPPSSSSSSTSLYKKPKPALPSSSSGSGYDLPSSQGPVPDYQPAPMNTGYAARYSYTAANGGPPPPPPPPQFGGGSIESPPMPQPSSMSSSSFPRFNDDSGESFSNLPQTDFGSSEDVRGRSSFSSSRPQKSDNDSSGEVRGRSKRNKKSSHSSGETEKFIIEVELPKESRDGQQSRSPRSPETPLVSKDFLKMFIKQMVVDNKAHQ